MSLVKAVYEFAAKRSPDSDIAQWWNWVKQNANKCRGTFFLPPGIWNQGQFHLPPDYTFNAWKEKHHGKEER